MMAPSEFFERCRSISYAKVYDVGEFGQPMSCYGFVYWFYKLCLGVELPSEDIEAFGSIQHVRYEKTQQPQDGDVVDLRSLRSVYQTHVGVLYKDFVYHFTESGLQSKNRFRMENWIKGFYHVVQD